jgi:hypothetical protein
MFLLFLGQVTFHFYFPFAHMPNATFLTQNELGKCLRVFEPTEKIQVQQKMATRHIPFLPRVKNLTRLRESLPRLTESA